MSEYLFTLQEYQMLGKQLIFIAGICCLLILGMVFLLLFGSERIRVKRYEVNNRSKLGLEPLQMKRKGRTNTTKVDNKGTGCFTTFSGFSKNTTC